MKHEDRGPLAWLPAVRVAEAIALIVCIVHLQAQCSPPIPGGERQGAVHSYYQHGLGTGLNLLNINFQYCKDPNGMWMVE